MNTEWYIVLSSLLFAVGAMGILIRRSPVVILLCLEIMLNAGNLSWSPSAAWSATSRVRSSRSS